MQFRKELKQRIQRENKGETASLDQEIAGLADHERRLKMYLLPRVGELDLAAIELATRRGKEDGDYIRERAYSCLERCNALAKRGESEWESCFSACSDDERVRRPGARCQDLNWLPF
jgi:hypothetical protein